MKKIAIWMSLPLLASSFACADFVPPGNVPIEIEPSSGKNTVITPVQIRGSFVVARLKADYSNPNAVETTGTVRAALRVPGTEELIGIQVVELSEERTILSVVHPGLVPGVYDVVVVDAYDRMSVQTEAFTVLQGTCDEVEPVDGQCSEICETFVDCACQPDGACALRCSDGRVQPGETCDDGNLDSFDGCSSACLEEPGYNCLGEPSVCDSSCGDGTVLEGEECDDGNVQPGDGCSPTCEVELGYKCSEGPRSRCDAVCGDGLVRGREECDDANSLEADGCTDCKIDNLWACNDAEPSSCAPVCGDGKIVEGYEECDDENVRPGDGCSHDCRVERGWSCPSEGQACEAICGDGIVVPAKEGCDPGPDQANAEGCTEQCQVVPGFRCVGEPSQCMRVACVQGDACNDGYDCSVNDYCLEGNVCLGSLAPNCPGAILCPDSCANILNLGIPCCSDHCLQGNCNTCKTAVSCSLKCTAVNCSATCEGGSACNFRHEPVLPGGGNPSSVVRCESGASCSVMCGAATVQGEPTECQLDCAAGAYCVMAPCGPNTSCTLNCQDGQTQTCPDGSQVCHRDCP